MILLESSRISHYYKKGGFFSRKSTNVALDDVSFTLQEGRGLGILGKNQAGKSTLARILLGLEKPSTGEVRIMGKKYSTHEKEIRKIISAVFQDSQSSLNPRFSARECILEPLKNCAFNPNKVQNLSHLVGLDEKELDKKSFYFSGGEAQRIALARALALNPKIIILDEALSNLDTHLQMRLIDTLKDLSDKCGITYIVISHDLRIILQLCKDIIVLKNGRIVFKTNIEEGVHNALQRDNGGEFSNIFHSSLRLNDKLLV